MNGWSKCVCNALADFCGAVSPCAIPGLLEAIERHDWLKAAQIIISAGECAAEIEVIIPVLAASAIACLLDDAGQPLTAAQLRVLDEAIEQARNK